MADQNQQPNNIPQDDTPQQQPDVSKTPSADPADGVPARPHFSAEGIEFNPQAPASSDEEVTAMIEEASQGEIQKPQTIHTPPTPQVNTPTPTPAISQKLHAPASTPTEPPTEPEKETQKAADVETPPIMHSMRTDTERALGKSGAADRPDTDRPAVGTAPQTNNVPKQAEAAPIVEKKKDRFKVDQSGAEAAETVPSHTKRAGAARPPITPNTKPEEVITPAQPISSSASAPNTPAPKSESATTVEKQASKKLGNLDALRARVSELSTEQTAKKDEEVVFNQPTQRRTDTQEKTSTEAAQTLDAQEKVAKPGSPLKQIKEAAKNTLVPPLRTYKEDVAKALQSKDTSYVGIVAKEQERRAKQTKDKTERRRGNLFYLIGGAISGLLVIGGIAVLAYVFLIDDGTPSTFPPQEVPALVFTEDKHPVDVTNLGRRAFLRILTNEKDAVDGSLGSIEQIYPIQSVDGVGTESRFVLLTAREFFEGVEARVPSSFLRALESNMTLGAHVFDGNQALLIVKVSFYENAFAGMLDWERFMNEDLAPLFGPQVDLTVETADGSPLSRIPFKDEIIRNKEVRVLRTRNNKSILLYSFIDRETLVITTNENTFNEVLTRITTSRM